MVYTDQLFMKIKKPLYKYSLLPLKYFYKLILFALFLIYLSTGGQAACILLKASLINLQDINALHSIIERSIQNNRLDSVTKWVHRRPLSETDALIEIITPKSGDMEPSLFFEISGY